MGLRGSGLDLEPVVRQPVPTPTKTCWAREAGTPNGVIVPFSLRSPVTSVLAGAWPIGIRFADRRFDSRIQCLGRSEAIISVSSMARFERRLVEVILWAVPLLKPIPIPLRIMQRTSLTPY